MRHRTSVVFSAFHEFLEFRLYTEIYGRKNFYRESEQQEKQPVFLDEDCELVLRFVALRDPENIAALLEIYAGSRDWKLG